MASTSRVPAVKEPRHGRTRWTARLAARGRVVSLLVIGAGLIAFARGLPVASLLGALEARIQELGFWGPIVYGLIYVAAVVALVPASALTIAAGALFGPLIGTVIASLASTAGAALAFLIARDLAREAVSRTLGRDPRFEAIDRSLGEGGWRIVALLRLSPAVPFNIQNYLLGLTCIPFWTYVGTSWIAMFPGTLMYVYLGYAGRSGLEAASGGRVRTPAEWGLLVVGLAATIVVTVYVTRLVRRALARPPCQASAESVDLRDSSVRAG